MSKKEEPKPEPKDAWERFLDKTGLKEETAEISDGYYEKTGYPDPKKAYRFIIETYGNPIEETYFWVLDHLKQDRGYPYIDKIVDSFSASETSSMWGNTTQRLNMQQERAGNYLRVISELIKQLFQIVRELRMVDEKLTARKAWKDPKTGKTSKSADVTLKGEFVELVEGGAKDVNSVYGLAREVGYHILPDLFFNTTIHDINKIDSVVDKMEYNTRIKNVLKKKLYNFLNWKINTDKEFGARREFQLKYLYQHWETIKTYSKWIAPYLRNIKKLTMNGKYNKSADLVSAFETSVIEIEFLARKPMSNGANSCILVNFYYTTKPEMSFHTPDYQHKGPVHVGKVVVNVKAYGLSDSQIEAYKKYKEEEDLELLGLADAKIQSAIDMLGDTFREYLAECDPSYKKKEEDQKNKGIQQESALAPFLSIFSGFAEIGRSFFPAKIKKEENKTGPDLDDLKKAAGDATKHAWLVFKVYKKSHGLLTW